MKIQLKIVRTLALNGGSNLVNGAVIVDNKDDQSAR